jgi:hypothetical protein
MTCNIKSHPVSENPASWGGDGILLQSRSLFAVGILAGSIEWEA